MFSGLWSLAAPKLAAIAGAVGLAIGIALSASVLTWGYSARLTAAENKRVAEVADLKRAHEQAVLIAAERHAKDIETARATEQALRDDIDRLQTDHAKERAHAQAEYDRLVADLRAGKRRLSVAVRACPAPAGGEAAPGAGAVDPAPRAELDPAAAERIVAIARDGDDAIRDLDACLGAYDAVRRRINGIPDGASAEPEASELK